MVVSRSASGTKTVNDAIAALTAQPQGEPVAFMFTVNKPKDAEKRTFAAIDYYEQDGEDIISKRPLIYADTAPQSGVREGMLLDALQRAQRVMHGEGVEDQGEAWDRCAEILDEAITRAAEQASTEDYSKVPMGPVGASYIGDTILPAPQSEQTVSVPVEPTEEMVAAMKSESGFSACYWHRVYAAMLRAATGKEDEHE